MSQCHVHSHLNLMSALLRQQVGVRAGRSTSIHPSIHPSLLLTMPVEPPHSIPSTKHRMRDKVMDREALASRSICIVLRFKTYYKSRSTKMDSAFLHLCPLEWRHPWGSWKGSNMTSLHRNQHAEGIIGISARIAPVPSVSHDVIDMILGIQCGITVTPHL